MVPPPSPFKDADPDDVVVTRVSPGSVSDPGLEAWGVLRSERRMRMLTLDDHVPGAHVGDHLIDGPEYRVAYVGSDGCWQAEGTLRREPPPARVLEQILRLQAEHDARWEETERRRGG